AQNLRTDPNRALRAFRAALWLLLTREPARKSTRLHVPDEHDDAGALRLNLCNRLAHKAGARAVAGQDVGDEIDAVDSGQNGFVGTDLAFDQRHVLETVELVAEQDEPESLSDGCLERRFENLLDELIVQAAMRDEIGDRADLQIMELRE